MSEPINDGGPAFPVPSVGTGDPRDGMTRGSDGMSLRDWFAGQETLGEYDNSDNISEVVCVALAGPKPQGNWTTNTLLEFLKWEAKWRAALKYIRADAMLAAREEGSK